MIVFDIVIVLIFLVAVAAPTKSRDQEEFQQMIPEDAFDFFEHKYIIATKEGKKRARRSLDILQLHNVSFVDAVSMLDVSRQAGTDNKLDVKALVYDGRPQFAAGIPSGRTNFVEDVGKRTSGVIAVKLSHELALETFLASGARTALIFEDDFGPRSDVRQLRSRLAEGLKRLPRDWGLVFLGRCFATCDQEQPVGDGQGGLYTSKRSYCLHAYGVSREGAQLVLKAMRECARLGRENAQRFKRMDLTACIADHDSVIATEALGMKAFAFAPEIIMQVLDHSSSTSLLHKNVQRDKELASSFKKHKKKRVFADCMTGSHRSVVDPSLQVLDWKRQSSHYRRVERVMMHLSDGESSPECERVRQRVDGNAVSTPLSLRIVGCALTRPAFNSQLSDCDDEQAKRQSRLASRFPSRFMQISRQSSCRYKEAEAPMLRFTQAVVQDIAQKALGGTMGSLAIEERRHQTLKTAMKLMEIGLDPVANLSSVSPATESMVKRRHSPLWEVAGLVQWGRVPFCAPSLHREHASPCRSGLCGQPVIAKAHAGPYRAAFAGAIHSTAAEWKAAMGTCLRALPSSGKDKEAFYVVREPLVRWARAAASLLTDYLSGHQGSPHTVFYDRHSPCKIERVGLEEIRFSDGRTLREDVVLEDALWALAYDSSCFCPFRGSAVFDTQLFSQGAAQEALGRSFTGVIQLEHTCKDCPQHQKQFQKCLQESGVAKGEARMEGRMPHATGDAHLVTLEAIASIMTKNPELIRTICATYYADYDLYDYRYPHECSTFFRTKENLKI